MSYQQQCCDSNKVLWCMFDHGSRGAGGGGVSSCCYLIIASEVRLGGHVLWAMPGGQVANPEGGMAHVIALGGCS